jgi:hypothetical protein
MSGLRAVIMFLTLIVAIGIGGWLPGYEGSAYPGNDRQKQSQKRRPANTDCVFLRIPEVVNGSAELVTAHRKRIARETYGYPQDIALGVALRIFNAELKCYSFFATLPPLTEEEVIANTVAGPDYSGTWGNDLQRAMKDIADKKTMPKGSLFTAESGGCDYGLRPRQQTCVKGLKIYLFLGLDKNPRVTKVLRPDQIVLIRKTYFDTEIER